MSSMTPIKNEGTAAVKVTETTSVEVKPTRPDNWRTLMLVGGIIAAAIIVAAYILTGVHWGTFYLFIAMYKGWTLINKYKDDTISEAVWILARRPITVLLFGLGMGIAGGSGYLGEPRVVLRSFAIGLLYGHFFFTPVVAESTRTRTMRTK